MAWTYSNNQQAVQAVSDTSLLEVGRLVAVDCENCDKEPLLGKRWRFDVHQQTFYQAGYELNSLSHRYI
jgi:hypothetical protein